MDRMQAGRRVRCACRPFRKDFLPPFVRLPLSQREVFCMSKKETGGALRRMMAYALLVALGVVFSRLLAIDAGVLRFNLGAVPVLLAGLIFGPLGGAVVGALADAIGGLLVGYTLNPFITLAQPRSGLCAGFCGAACP
jgi:hypothetical protein